MAIRDWRPGHLAVAWVAGALGAVLIWGAYQMWSRAAATDSTDAGIYAAQAISPPGTPFGAEPAWAQAERQRRYAIFNEKSEQEYRTRAWLHPLAFLLSVGVIPAALLTVTWRWVREHAGDGA